MGFLKDFGGIIGGVGGFLLGGPAGAALGSSIGGALGGAEAQKEAGQAQGKASAAAIAEQRAATEAFNARTEPFRQLGAGAISPLLGEIGLKQNPGIDRINRVFDRQIDALNQRKFDPSTTKAGFGLAGARNLLRNAKEFDADTQAQIQALEAKRQGQISSLSEFLPSDTADTSISDANQQLQDFISNPNQQLSEINPIVDFLRQQGFEQVQESAAAQGRLGAGGTLQDLTKFDANLTSTIVPQLQAQRFNELTSNVQTQGQLQNQRFNQLFNVAGIGANAAAGQGNAALQTGTNVSNLIGMQGAQQAGSILGQQQQVQGGIENIGATLGAFPGLFGGQPPAPIASNNALAAPAFSGGPAPVVDLSTF